MKKGLPHSVIIFASKLLGKIVSKIIFWVVYIIFWFLYAIFFYSFSPAIPFEIVEAMIVLIIVISPILVYSGMVYLFTKLFIKELFIFKRGRASTSDNLIDKEI
ncbi:MAG: hypothetical protein QG567_1716 [Campylobacterota bacterium]|nr:hypothetical protein [Campylobacterota bacterium]